MCKYNSWKWLWRQTGKLWVWSDWVTQGLSHSAVQSSHAEITKDRIYILPTLPCLKIFKYKICTGFFSVQCHWLQCRRWFRARYIPAEFWDRHLFPLQLSLFIVFKCWQVSPQQSSCLAKNVGRPLLCHLLRTCLWFSSLKQVGGFGHQFLLGFWLLRIQTVINSIWGVTCNNMHP